MKKLTIVAMALIILVGAMIIGVAGADNPATYEVYIVGDHVCVDFGEWGECFCPCDASCTPLGEGIGGGPPGDMTELITPIPPGKSPLPTVPTPTDDGPGPMLTSTAPPIPTREVPPTAVSTRPARPTPAPVMPPTDVPKDSCHGGNPGNDKCVGNSGEKDESFNPPPEGPGTRGRSDRHDKSDGPGKPRDK